MDEFESEVEGLANTGKRKSKAPPKLAHFEESIVRHRQHVLRLEQMLRLLDNESLSVDEVSEAREMVDDYIERNQVPPPNQSLCWYSGFLTFHRVLPRWSSGFLNTISTSHWSEHQQQTHVHQAVLAVARFTPNFVLAMSCSNGVDFDFPHHLRQIGALFSSVS